MRRTVGMIVVLVGLMVVGAAVAVDVFRPDLGHRLFIVLPSAPAGSGAFYDADGERVFDANNDAVFKVGD